MAAGMCSTSQTFADVGNVDAVAAQGLILPLCYCVTLLLQL